MDSYAPTGLSPEDEGVIIRFYEQGQILRLRGPREFLNMISEKIIIEWVRDTEIPPEEKERGYGGVLRKFVDEETHYEMKRIGKVMGFEWDKERRFFKGEGNPAGIYPLVRAKVLTAIATRAYCLFERFSWINFPFCNSQNGTKLRSSLEGHLDTRRW